MDGHRHTKTSKKENKVGWDDFLNPRSMLTPGVAGSIVMVIANTLWLQFMLPQKWTALILSFILIIPILIKYSASRVENIIYFVFNGLIVFALSVNTNFAGRTLQEVVTADKPVLTSQVIHAAFADVKSSNNLNSLNNLNNSEEKSILLAANETTNRSTTTTTVTREKKSVQIDRQNDRSDSSQKPTQKRDKNQREFFGQWF